MRGSPLVRLLFLALALGGAGWLVARVAGPATGPPAVEARPSGRTADPGVVVVEAYVEVHLSAPARRIAWTGPRDEDPAILDLVPDGLQADAEVSLPLRDGVPTGRTLVVDWADRDRSHFLHLVVEPAARETVAHTLFFPPGETTLDLRWPADRD